MCGIVGYIGKNLCRDRVLKNLAHLEYRGYDSAGFVCIDAHHKHFSFSKEAGGVAPLKRLRESVKFDGYIGMGHIRWATHGTVEIQNTHPHFNCNRLIAVVHNGVIEGYEILREYVLGKGHTLSSSTDTELTAHIFNDFIEQGLSLKEAAIKLVKMINGAYSLLFMHEDYPDTLIAIRHRSPLVVGVGEDEMLVASDVAAINDFSSKGIFLPDNSIAFIKKNTLELYSFDGKELPFLVQNIHQQNNHSHDFEDQLVKEIYEQKRSINRTIAFCKMIGSVTQKPVEELFDFAKNQQLPLEYNDSIWRQLGLKSRKIKELDSLYLVSAGTSWNSARVARFYFETLCKIPTRVYGSSEFKYMPHFTNNNALYIMISESGETPDTLDALRLVNSYDCPTVAITNVSSSSMVREASGFLPMQAGPDIAGSKIKAFTTQVSTFYWLSNRMALERDEISPRDMYEAEENLYIASEVLETSVDMHKIAISQTIAPALANYNSFVIFGRQISYPLGIEASLKFKDIAGIFAQCYPAGEMQHGVSDILGMQTPCIIFSVLDQLVYNKLVLDAQEVKEQKSKLIVFAFEGQDELIELADHAIVLPLVTPLLAPVAMAGVTQYLIHQIARQKNLKKDLTNNVTAARIEQVAQL